MTLDEAKDAVVRAALCWRDFADDGAAQLCLAVERYRGLLPPKRNVFQVLRNVGVDLYGDSWEELDVYTKAIANELNDLEAESKEPR